MTTFEDLGREIGTTVLHEFWCGVFKGKPCDCYPIKAGTRRSWPEDG